MSATTITTTALETTIPATASSRVTTWTTKEALNAAFKTGTVSLAAIATVAAIAHKNPAGFIANTLNTLKEKITPSTCAITLASTAMLPELIDAGEELFVKNKIKGFTLTTSVLITFLAIRNS